MPRKPLDASPLKDRRPTEAGLSFSFCRRPWTEGLGTAAARSRSLVWSTRSDQAADVMENRAKTNRRIDEQTRSVGEGDPPGQAELDSRFDIDCSYFLCQ